MEQAEDRSAQGIPLTAFEVDIRAEFTRNLIQLCQPN
jgi:hypothetical protein